MTDTDRLPTTRFGFACDVRGFHVVMPWQGRELLGEIVGVGYREFGCSGFELTVKQFNGEPWPIKPMASAVRVLRRDA